MKRHGIILVLVAVAGAACQADATGPDPEDATTLAAFQAVEAGVVGSATGSAHLTVFPPPVPPGLGTRNFGFSAIKYADGSVSGQWQIVAGGTILHGAIDCLTIAADGSSARISGLVTDTKFSFFVEGTAFAMEVFDNSSGASGEPDVSTQLRAFQNAPPAVGREFCENGTVPLGADLDPLPTEEGNFVIRVAD